MRKYVVRCIVVLLLLLPVATAMAGGKKEGGGAAESEGPTELEFWTFQQSHIEFFEEMVPMWNDENPDRQISLNATAYPYSDMHNNLLVALQSGTGAPDMVDIEIGRFPGYLRGDVPLRNMNDYVDPVRDDFVEARFEVFSHEGNVYGLPFHVGLSVMYYNMEIINEAGVDIDAIETWDDYVEAGRQVVQNTDAWMTTLEADDPWFYWPLITQQKSDFVGPNGELTLDNETNIETLQYLVDMVYEHEIARVAPGGSHHAEEYYGWMAEGGAASVWMPLWYMNRFTDYMSDLQGQIAIRPLPRWTEGGFRSAGMGGTGTSIPTQGDNVELAAAFNAFAKLSEEGNILIWEILGFDPPMSAVWDSEALRQENEFTNYFTNGTNIFPDFIELTDEIHPVTVSTDTPEILNLIRTEIMVQAIAERSATPAEALRSAAEQIRNN